MLRGTTKLIISMLGVSGLFGCATTDHLVKADKHGRYISIVSSGDKVSPAARQAKDSDLDQSIKALEQRLKKSKRDIALRLSLSQLYILKGNLNLAEKHCRIAIRYDVKNTESRKVLAQIFLRKSNFDMANIILSSIGGDQSKDAQIINMLGQIALQSGDNARALALLKRSVELDPANIGARMNLSVMYIRYRQIDSAAVELERVLKIMPDHPDAKMNLAIVKATRGEMSAAEEIYEDILDKDPEHPLSLYNLASVQRRMQEYDDSIENLKSFLKTEYARTEKYTDQVFALIDEIEQENASGGKLSDDEIQKIAREDGSNNSPVSRTAKAESQPIEESTDELEKLSKELGE
jgi:Flp pilus assembly protein TadD